MLRLVRVLFVAAEGSPLVKTGGLGDVIGSLPRELHKYNIDARVILPKYRHITASFHGNSMFGETLVAVPLAWRHQCCRLEKTETGGVPYYLIANDYYFDRDGLYGFADDAERFAFFSRAVLEVLPYLDFIPDIIHCHDWQAALVPVFMHAFYPHLRRPVVFTIHNLQYQGIFPRSILGDILGLGEEYFTVEGLEFFGQVNFLKGGLVYSDIITTVSETYAREIQTPSFGEKLDGLLRRRKDSLWGIRNGIDYDFYDPRRCPHIFVPYDYKTYQMKQTNKIELQKYLGLPQRQEIPLVAVVSRLVKQKGFDLIAEVMKDILALDIQLVVLGTGEKKYQMLFEEAAARRPDKVSVRTSFDESLACRIYAASDIFLMPSLFEPCGLGQMIALRFGSVPVVRETGGLKDTIQPFDREKGTGNGFRFSGYCPWEMLMTLKKAVGLYSHQKSWAKVVVNAMLTDCSWETSIKKYQGLYEQMLYKQGKGG